MASRKPTLRAARRIAVCAAIPLILAACAMLLGCSPSGSCGTCTWEVDSDGTLVVRPSKGDEGVLDLWEELSPWAEKAGDKIKHCRFEGTIHAKTCRGMFYGCESLAAIDLSGLETSQVNAMERMFEDCTSLSEIDVSGLDTAQVKSTSEMFRGCSSAKWISVSGWDTSQVTSVGEMFRGCSSLKSLDLSGWDTSRVTSTRLIFSHCTKLETLDLSGWDTSSIDSMDGMFWNCPSLLSIKIGKNYAIRNENMFPDATAAEGKWWSEKDGRWYSKDEIVSSRSGVTDTYRSSQA